MTDLFKRYGYDNAHWADDLDCLRGVGGRAQYTRIARQRARIRLARELREEVEHAEDAVLTHAEARLYEADE